MDNALQVLIPIYWYLSLARSPPLHMLYERKGSAAPASIPITAATFAAASAPATIHTEGEASPATTATAAAEHPAYPQPPQ